MKKHNIIEKGAELGVFEWFGGIDDWTRLYVAYITY
jgi:hypothetical protein